MLNFVESKWDNPRDPNTAPRRVSSVTRCLQYFFMRRPMILLARGIGNT